MSNKEAQEFVSYQRLGRAVITNCISDAVKKLTPKTPTGEKIEIKEARRDLTQGGEMIQYWCDVGGIPYDKLLKFGARMEACGWDKRQMKEFNING